MYLQGSLQNMFDALYNMGIIDPVLEKDWSQALEEIHNHITDFEMIINTVNTKQQDVDELMYELEKFDLKVLEYLAMEVAKEFADYHSRDLLH